MGMLYVVATPIGNLSDLTWRAVETLKSVDSIACEDTRHSKILLEHYGIDKPLVSYHQHSGPVKTERILAELGLGKSMALVTDAGTPGINDPGGKLVEDAVAAGHTIIPIPGACALAAALSVSGLPADRFEFLGFLPHKKGRQTLFQHIVSAEITIVFYESTHRIIKTLQQLAAGLPSERRVVVCRELTKQFESIYRGSAEHVLHQLEGGVTKGEFVVIVGPP